MTYQAFLTLMLHYQKFQHNLQSLYTVGVDLLEGKYEVNSQVYTVFKQAFLNTYTEQGWEWIEWFIFENDWGHKDWLKYEKKDDSNTTPYPATDENGNPIAYSFESLFELLEKSYKI